MGSRQLADYLRRYAYFKIAQQYPGLKLADFALQVQFLEERITAKYRNKQAAWRCLGIGEFAGAERGLRDLCKQVASNFESLVYSQTKSDQALAHPALDVEAEIWGRALPYLKRLSGQEQVEATARAFSLCVYQYLARGLPGFNFFCLFVSLTREGRITFSVNNQEIAYPDSATQALEKHPRDVALCLQATAHHLLCMVRDGK